MAFAALHPEAGRVDATLPDLGRGLAWTAVHKARPRVALTCPDCGHGMHAKVSTRGLRYFAHDPGRPGDCAWDNESLEHHLLKLELATSVRDAGWHAELEVRAPDGTWRADVLASTHDGSRRVALEAQLSPIGDDEIIERTDRYEADGIGVCWVTAGKWPQWMEIVPSAWVVEPAGGRPWAVGGTVARFDYAAGNWRTVPVSLTQFIAWVLNEQLLIHEVRPRYRRVLWETSGKLIRRQNIWTTQRSVDSEDRHELMRQRQEARKREAEKRKQEAEQREREEAEARKAEEQRQQEIKQAAELARAEKEYAERLREREIRAQQFRQQREAEKRRREEAARAAEEARRRQEQRELEAARAWWEELSGAQWKKFRDAVAGPVLKREGTRLQFDEKAAAGNGYGIAARRKGRLYGILRPSPASLHKVPDDVPVYVRNAREARQITDTAVIAPDRVVHFDLPDFEQQTLI